MSIHEEMLPENAELHPDVYANAAVECSCCPYGYHIHVDFVEFSESLVPLPAQAEGVGASLESPRDNSQNGERSAHLAEAEIADWNEVETMTADFFTALHELALHECSETCNNTEDLLDLQEKLKILTEENQRLKDVRLPTPSRSSVGLQVNDSEFQDNWTGKSISTASLQGVEKLNVEVILGQKIDKKTGGDADSDPAPRTTSRIPRLNQKSPTKQRQQNELRTIPRARIGPSEEMKTVLKLLNEALFDEFGHESENVHSSIGAVYEEWVRVAGAKILTPKRVKEYLEYFSTNFSPEIVHRIVNMADTVGNTALHYAVSRGNFDLASTLLDFGACDPDRHNNAGYTSLMLIPLTEIQSDKDRNVVRRLFDLGDVNARSTQHEQTTLMLAAAQGRLETVRLLVEAGAGVNLQDEDGSTALMCAVEHGHADVIRYLLSVPACDPSIADNDGYTVLEVAMEAGNKEVAVLLYARMNFTDSGTDTKNSSPRSSNSSSTPESGI